MMQTTRALRSWACAAARAPRWRGSSTVFARGAKSAAPAPGAERSLASVHSDGCLTATGLPVWAGGDVGAVVYDDISTMMPCGIASLPGRVWNAPVRNDLVHRTVVWQLAGRRAGTAKTKNRSEVAYSGRKVRPQKGTGRSRQGARSSPIFRGGGRAHGPVPRDYSFALPRNVRRAALRGMLTSKLACGQLWIVEKATVPGARTKDCLAAMRRLGWRSALVIDDVEDAPAGVDPSFKQASHVVQRVLTMNVRGLNVYDALSFDMLVLTRAALDKLHARFELHDQFV